jgi:photosystem II stability/assembly factor-like uncharacterized protein
LNPQRSYGGTQDNGTLRTLTGNADDWEAIYGGDGFYAIVDYSDARYVYAEFQYGNLAKSTNGGSPFSFIPATDGISSEDRTNWSTPVEIDPQNPRTLYYGANRLYRTRNRAVSWTAISPDLTNGPGPANLVFGTITTIAVSPVDSNLIYVGTDDANVWRTPDGGKNWLRIVDNLPTRWVTRVAADPAEVGTAYVTFSGHASGSYLPHIFRTTNQGDTWIDVSGNLPPAPINDVVIDPSHTATLYIGTDVGVFYTTALGANWQPLGTGMPFVPVHDLTLHPDTRKLRAATHGRSFYEFDLATLTAVASAENPPPSAFELLPNYPNPISASSKNPITNIEFNLREPREVRLEVFDLLGRKIATLADGVLAPGLHRRQMRVTNLPSGIYFVKLTVTMHEGQGFTQSRQFEIVR